MDIRSYFSSNRKSSTTPKSDILTKTKTKTSPLSTNKKQYKRLIESDSDEDNETFNDTKRKKKTEKILPKRRTKRIIDSSDESNDDCKKKSKTDHRDKNPAKKRKVKLQISDSSPEEVSPKKSKSRSQTTEIFSSNRKPKLQCKLENPIGSSKFLKETSANAVFGDEPVKRSDNKMKDIQEKLKHFVKPKLEIKMEDDADFEAALQQLDEVGDSWVDWKEIQKNEKQSTNSDTNKTSKTTKNKKYLARDTKELRWTAMNRNILKEKFSCEEKIDSLPDSQSSGYFSASLSSDSQSVDECRKVDRQDEAHIVDENAVLEFVVKERKHVNSLPKIKSDTSEKVAERVPTKKKFDELKRSIPEQIEKIDSSGERSIALTTDDYSLWVEKYKPQSSKKIIGQQGDKSNVKKLTDWLNSWYKNNSGSKKASFVPSGWSKDPTRASFRAALLSGPPGVGKTTSVMLVCQELGFDIVEFNASDTRSKKLLQEEVSELLGSTSLNPYFSIQKNKHAGVTKKHVLVMDEVDGMAGNEDRGGIQELIQLIKTTKVPIICMCNDRNHPKIRSLVNYCFDLRFSRPRAEQIKGFMRTVCFKEKLDISTETLSDIISSANNDIRLVLNHLSMLAADKSNLESAKKYVKLNAWDVLRKVFSKDDHKNMSIHDKCDLFFYDYSIAPLFVQENYLMVKPLNPDAQSKHKKMELYARAADSISMGDRIDLRIRQHSAWSLLPTQAIFASYAPGQILEGFCTAQINFPSWLGKYSKQNKINRLLQELQIHTRFKISGSKDSVNLDYASHLKNRIIEPLVQNGTDGVGAALDVLRQYDLLKDDLDSLIEVCQWPNCVNPMAALDSKVKAAFTRAYNKNPPVPPYSLTAIVKKGHKSAEDEMYEEENDNGSEHSDDEVDAMIITKKKQPPKKQTAAVPSTSNTKVKKNKENKRGHKK